MGFEHTESAVALIGLDGFRLLAAVEVDGELHQLVETTAEVVGCSGCGARALSKGRWGVRLRDLPAGGRRVVMVWRKRIWRCPDADRLRRVDVDGADRGDRAAGVSLTDRGLRLARVAGFGRRLGIADVWHDPSGRGSI